MKNLVSAFIGGIRYFFHPEECPPGWKLVFILASLISSLFLLFLNKTQIGNVVSTFSAIPMICIAWFFGLKIGLISYLTITPLIFLISFHYEIFNLEALNQKDGIIIALLLAVTAGIGYIADDKEKKWNERKDRLSVDRQNSVFFARLNSLYQHTDDGILILDKDNLIQYPNPSACRMLGASESFLIGKLISSFLKFDNGFPWQDSTGWLHSPKPLKGETIISIDDGSTVNIEYTFIPTAIQFENILILRDISQAQKNKLELNQLIITERQNRSLAEALSRSAAALNSSLNLDEVLDQILTNIGRVVPHTAVNFMLVEGDNARIVRAQGYEIFQQEDFILTITYTIHDHYNLSYLVQQKQPLAIGNTRKDPRWFQSDQLCWIASYAAAPVIIDGEVIGFLNLDSQVENQYTQEHADRLMAFANQAAIAIRNARVYSQLQAKASHNALINDLTLAAISASTLRDMAQVLADKLLDLYEAYGTYITLWNEKNHTPVPYAASGYLRDEYSKLSVDSSEFTLTHLALERKEPLVIADITLIQGISQTIMEFLKDHHALVLPLIADQMPLGAIIIVFPIGQEATSSDLALAGQLCPQISLAVAKARLLDYEQQQHSETDRTNQLLSALSRMAARISSANDLETIFSTLGDELKSIGVYCLLGLREEDSSLLSIRYFSSPHTLPEKWKRYMNLFDTFTSEFPLFPMIMELKQSVYIQEPIPLVIELLSPFPEHIQQQLINLIGFHAGTKAISLPLITGETVVGVITLWGDDIRETDQPAALLFSSQVAIAIQKAQLITKIQQMVITDDLTGVFNRRGMFTLGQQEIERARRFNHPLSLLFIDVDYFKDINDQYGHHIGDEVLLHIARRIRKNIRDLDYIGRYGGDEFLVILVESDLEEAIGISSRIMASLAGESIQSSVGSVSATLSIGVAELNDLDEGFDSLVVRTDHLLYLAKESGRNRIIFESKE